MMYEDDAANSANAPKRITQTLSTLRLSKAIVLTTTTIIEIGSSTASLAMGTVAAHSMPALARTHCLDSAFYPGMLGAPTGKPEKRNDERAGVTKAINPANAPG